MDEAAAKLRVALYSMPPELKTLKAEIDQLQAEEEQAGAGTRLRARRRRRRPSACGSKRNSTRKREQWRARAPARRSGG